MSLNINEESEIENILQFAKILTKIFNYGLQIIGYNYQPGLRIPFQAVGMIIFGFQRVKILKVLCKK
jgi:hypothetical protein